MSATIAPDDAPARRAIARSHAVCIRYFVYQSALAATLLVCLAMLRVRRPSASGRAPWDGVPGVENPGLDLVGLRYG
jgi:hypothetical protein